MIRAAFITQHQAWPWSRQLPPDLSLLGGVEFFAAPQEADVIFVYDDLPCKQIKVATSAYRIFFASEPRSVKVYSPRFLAQFDLVITSDRETPHPNRIFSQAGLNWFVGATAEQGAILDDPMKFEDFERHFPVKTKLVSVVSSNKDFTQEHRDRLAFVEKLKEAFGDQIDVFGRGIKDFPDKRDVLDTYRYHIAIENCAAHDYWTEKLADPFLTLTYPIYHGCPNIFDYFPESALTRIDIYNPEQAISVIREILHSDLAEKRREQLIAARRSVLSEYNIFFLMAKMALSIPASERNRRRRKTIYSEAEMLPFRTKVKPLVRDMVADMPRIRMALRFVYRLARRVVTGKPC